PPNDYNGWGIVNAYAAIHLGPDSDADGIADVCDCAPADGGAYEVPPQVANDSFDAAQVLKWDSLAPFVGSGVHYDLARGLISQLRSDHDFHSASCAANDLGATSFGEASSPPAGDAYYYLVRGQNGCGTGSYGNSSGGTPRSV